MLYILYKAWWKNIEVERERLTYVFIDLEKAYNKVPRKILWKVLKKKEPVLHISELSMVCMMYEVCVNL